MRFIEMAKLGKCDFPEIGLVESIELGQKIAREFAGEVSRQGLARSLGMSQRGGAFSARLGALRMWGVAVGRSRVRLTRDGLRAITPLSTKEGEDARIQLAQNVPLFTEMSTRLGDQLYGADRFGVLLEELSGADRTEVARRLALIDRIFSEVRSYLPKNQFVPIMDSGNPAGTSLDNAVPIQSETDVTNPVFTRDVTYSAPAVGESSPNIMIKDRIELGLPDGKLSLPETLANLDAALTVLWERRQLIAAIDAVEGRAASAPPRDFLATLQRPK
jgi:hypothetical protein